MGYGWHRKHMFSRQIHSGQRTTIEFEAAFQDVEIFVNGDRVGEHLGGYTGLWFDITKALHSGDNVFAVRFNNKWNTQLNPRAGLAAKSFTASALTNAGFRREKCESPASEL